MTNTVKMTYERALDNAITALTNTDLVSAEVLDKLVALKASYIKRNTRQPDKETKAQREAREFATATFEFVTKEPKQSKEIAEAMTASGKFGQVSFQKVSAALRKLIANQVVVKTEEKGHSYFARHDYFTLDNAPESKSETPIE